LAPSTAGCCGLCVIWALITPRETLPTSIPVSLFSQKEFLIKGEDPPLRGV